MGTSRWITLTIVLAMLATALQIAGFVAPMWIWLDVDTFRVGVGLWFTTGCGLHNTCDTTPPSVSFGYTTDETWEKDEFNAVRALETLAVAGGILLVFLLLVYGYGYGKWSGMDQLNMAAFITAVLTWVCVLAGLIVFCAYYWPVVGTSPLLTSTSFPWSLFMCLLAAAIFIIVCTLIRVKCRHTQRLNHAIPVSGDSKMDFHPVTKHGLLHRYFTTDMHGLRNTKQVAIGYKAEGRNVHSMNRRLIGAEERHGTVATVDNAALNGQTVNNVKYRFLPVQNGSVAHNQTETVVRRTLPTAVVTYTDTNQNATCNHVTETSINKVAGGDGRWSKECHGASGDVLYQRDGHGTRASDVWYLADPKGTKGQCSTRLLHQDSGFSGEGRSDTDYIVPTTEMCQNFNHIGTTDKSLTGYLVTQTTHTVTSHVDSEVVKPYDPTYIYRPYSEQVN